jgi:hypothetical protein
LKTEIPRRETIPAGYFFVRQLSDELLDYWYGYNQTDCKGIHPHYQAIAEKRNS